MDGERFTFYGGQRGGGKIFHLEQALARKDEELKQVKAERDIVAKKLSELELKISQGSGCNSMMGYDMEELARVAMLIKECGVKPCQVAALSNNVAKIYGLIIKQMRTEIEEVRDNFVMKLRFPGILEVLKELADA